MTQLINGPHEAFSVTNMFYQTSLLHNSRQLATCSTDRKFEPHRKSISTPQSNSASSSSYILQPIIHLSSISTHNWIGSYIEFDSGIGIKSEIGHEVGLVIAPNSMGRLMDLLSVFGTWLMIFGDRFSVLVFGCMCVGQARRVRESGFGRALNYCGYV